MKWEYKTVKFNFSGMFRLGEIDSPEFERVLNFHGWEGWELVNVFDTNAGGATRYINAIFKRPVVQNEGD